MTRADYLDQYQEHTSLAMAEIALNLGRQDWDEATTQLTTLRAWQDALWTQYEDEASEGVKP